MTALSIGLLAVVLATCLAGLYSRAYRDNWGQCAGLVLLGLWAGAEAAAVLQEPAVPQRDVMLYVALAAYAVGTALKVLHHHPDRRRDAGVSTQSGEIA